MKPYVPANICIRMFMEASFTMVPSENNYTSTGGWLNKYNGMLLRTLKNVVLNEDVSYNITHTTQFHW